MFTVECYFMLSRQRRAGSTGAEHYVNIISEYGWVGPGGLITRDGCVLACRGHRPRPGVPVPLRPRKLKMMYRASGFVKPDGFTKHQNRFFDEKRYKTLKHNVEKGRNWCPSGIHSCMNPNLSYVHKRLTVLILI